MSRTLVLVLAAALLAGCASRNACVGDTEYQQAVSMPPPATVDGLKIPESASALRIPPVPAGAQPVPEGTCLQTPPAMPEVALDKPGKEVEVAPPSKAEERKKMTKERLQKDGLGSKLPSH
ncbi:hypothetical protein C3942_13340 [Solimonas fluminis]|uniref:Uncharacterized protein n=1 Tax=Solimonas fluminis TaxID=2086571 RepID=A0A2S5TE44_9GAMM|nr:hypothetical protein [Solimonas fluminis]PPE73255.1 hypothetical protein C3942_13340 [Solimonas fluminis]